MSHCAGPFVINFGLLLRRLIAHKKQPVVRSSVKTILAGLPWWGGGGRGGGSVSLVVKELFVGGLRGALEIGVVLVNVFCKKFARGA